MKLVFYTNSISPHQLPLALELVSRLGRDDYRYVYAASLTEERRKLGWSEIESEWIVSEEKNRGTARKLLEECDVLLSGLRDLDLFEKRSLAGKRTIYCGERWFKPPLGMLRLLHPSYFRMAFRFMRLVKRGALDCLPIGVIAARDMARLFGLFSGDPHCLFRSPRLVADSRPMGAVKGYLWMHVWGYFVAPSRGLLPGEKTSPPTTRALRVLWCGRLLALKRVDTLFKAVFAVASRRAITLTVVGRGPERESLRRLEKRLCTQYGLMSPICWHDAVSIAEVRVLMRRHDVYVLSSNGYEGWGAVVGEAIEEGMRVIGTYEAGASATILPKSCLYHAGDVKRLAELLARVETECETCGDKERWSAASAAGCLVRFASEGDL